MDFITLLFIFIVLELFESTWQKSPTLHGLVLNNFHIYKKNIFLYFILHPTFIFTIFVSLYLNNFGLWMSSILIIKFLDISFKLNLMKKLSSGLDISEIITFNVNMTPLFRYMNVLIYPVSFIFAVGLI
ncbi:hypothetical protein LPB137_11595 [Poseidonibacter parvus]|uniref:Uncharacterized protein n=2 Tax=Poseidonibacter parvus TaxID=1850254 RepID=A0A1P8KPL7_9BACT|nr:hypothetical protein LPB137_11595 [Poseidonibacter parvus]